MSEEKREGQRDKGAERGEEGAAEEEKEFRSFEYE